MCAAVIIALANGPARAWEPVGHTLITERAITLLPSEIKPFYDVNSRYIAAFCTLPDDWKQTHKDAEGSRHFIDLDILDQAPFGKVMVDRATAEKQFGKKQLSKAGVLPWIIEEHYAKLVDAMKAGNSVEIAVQSALLAHYVGDAHVPLHATQYYDGKTPDEKGLHFRWEQTLFNTMLKPEQVSPRAPEKIGSILRSAFGWCVTSNSYCAPIFKADDDARKRDPGMSYGYYRMMWESTGPIMLTQLRTASEALAGVYIAAWQDAGKPELGNKCAAFFWEEQ